MCRRRLARALTDDDAGVRRRDPHAHRTLDSYSDWPPRAHRSRTRRQRHPHRARSWPPRRRRCPHLETTLFDIRGREVRRIAGSPRPAARRARVGVAGDGHRVPGGDDPHPIAGKVRGRRDPGGVADRDDDDQPRSRANGLAVRRPRARRRRGAVGSPHRPRGRRRPGRPARSAWPVRPTSRWRSISWTPGSAASYATDDRIERRSQRCGPVDRESRRRRSGSPRIPLAAHRAAARSDEGNARATVGRQTHGRGGPGRA